MNQDPSMAPRTTAGAAATGERIEFVRLTEVPLASVVELLNEPRNARHMPLSSDVTAESAAAWVAAKDGQWSTHGYGPWAVLVNDTFAGWGGFQREENGADFALVLLPAFWGYGGAITRAALDRGFDELGLESVLIALPFSRSPDRAVRRFGFVPDGVVSYDGTDFRQYRLSRDDWRRVRETGRT
jgi:RimJ/RimL family protein N-acetyltransferase